MRISRELCVLTTVLWLVPNIGKAIAYPLKNPTTTVGKAWNVFIETMQQLYQESGMETKHVISAMCDNAWLGLIVSWLVINEYQVISKTTNADPANKEIAPLVEISKILIPSVSLFSGMLHIFRIGVRDHAPLRLQELIQPSCWEELKETQE